MLQPPRSTVDEARHLFQRAESEGLDRQLQRDLYVLAAKTFLEAASNCGNVVRDRSAVDALLFLSTTSLRKADHIEAIIAALRVDKPGQQQVAGREDAKTVSKTGKPTNLVIATVVDDQNERSMPIFKSSISGRIVPSNSLLSPPAGGDAESNSSLRVSGLRNIPKAAPNARVDAVNDLFFLEKKLAEMGMLSMGSSFKKGRVDGVGGDGANVGTAYLASALGESFMLLSAGRGRSGESGRSSGPTPATATAAAAAGQAKSSGSGGSSNHSSSGSAQTQAQTQIQGRAYGSSKQKPLAGTAVATTAPPSATAAVSSADPPAGSAATAPFNWVSAAKEAVSIPWAAGWGKAKGTPDVAGEPLGSDGGRRTARDVHWNEEQSVYGHGHGSGREQRYGRDQGQGQGLHPDEIPACRQTGPCPSTQPFQAAAIREFFDGRAPVSVPAPSRGASPPGGGDGSGLEGSSEGILRLLKSVKRLGKGPVLGSA